MWKGPMKCPLVVHSFKWDRQANYQDREKRGRREEGSAQSRSLPSSTWTTVGGFLLWYQQDKDKFRYGFMSLSHRVSTSFGVKSRLEHSSLHGSIHDILICFSLNHSAPPRSQISLTLKESFFQPWAPCIYQSLCPQWPCPNYQEPLFVNYQLSSGICSKVLSWTDHLILYPSLPGMSLWLCFFGISNCQNKSIILTSYSIYWVPFTRT